MGDFFIVLWLVCSFLVEYANQMVSQLVPDSELICGSIILAPEVTVLDICFIPTATFFLFYVDTIHMPSKGVAVAQCIIF